MSLYDLLKLLKDNGIEFSAAQYMFNEYRYAISATTYIELSAGLTAITLKAKTIDNKDYPTCFITHDTLLIGYYDKEEHIVSQVAQLIAKYKELDIMKEITSI